MTRIPVALGANVVSAGTALAQLDDLILQKHIVQAQAQVEIARKQQAQASTQVLVAEKQLAQLEPANGR